MKLSSLEKAFAIAHKLSMSDKIEQPNRNYYRAIAHLIWTGLGAPPEQGMTEEKMDALGDFGSEVAAGTMTEAEAIAIVEAADGPDQLLGDCMKWHQFRRQGNVIAERRISEYRVLWPGGSQTCGTHEEMERAWREHRLLLR